MYIFSEIMLQFNKALPVVMRLTNLITHYTVILPSDWKDSPLSDSTDMHNVTTSLATAGNLRSSSLMRFCRKAVLTFESCFSSLFLQILQLLEQSNVKSETFEQILNQGAYRKLCLRMFCLKLIANTQLYDTCITASMGGLRVVRSMPPFETGGLV